MGGGGDLALAFADVPRRPLDAPREAVREGEQDGGDAQRQQREPPVEREHDPHHAHQGQATHEDADQPLGNQILDRLGVGSQCAHELADAALVVIRQ